MQRNIPVGMLMRKPFSKFCFHFFIPAILSLVLPYHVRAEIPEQNASEESVISESAADEKVLEREQAAQEDPLAVRQSKRVDREDQWAEEPSGIDLYGSARIRYRVAETESFWGDGDSRIGANGSWQYAPRQWFFGRIEIGLNLLDELDRAFDPASRSRRNTDNKAFVRLGYLGIETSNAIYVLGKNWSTYYQVASFTDRFDSIGGEATGVYNAGTDGGAFGTGRADGVLQSRFLIDFPDRFHIKPFHLNVQVQYDQPIPQVSNAHYGMGIGLSAIYETNADFSIGFAYNYAQVKHRDDPDLINAGIDGNAHAGLLGLRVLRKRWLAATTIARLQNVETTDQGIYFDGWGWEVYGHYQIASRWWLVSGWNILNPDSGETQAGRYRLQYAVAGVRFSIKDFQRYLFFDTRLSNGRHTDGSHDENIYTVGINWNF